MIQSTWCEECRENIFETGCRECKYCGGKYCYACIEEHEKYCILKDKEDIK